MQKKMRMTGKSAPAHALFFIKRIFIYCGLHAVTYLLSFSLSAFSAPLFSVRVGIEVYSVYVQLVSTHLRVVNLGLCAAGLSW